jgi:hypothetical protein
MRILRPCHAKVAGIFFPIGKPSEGGTCQYASSKCVNYCYAVRDKEYDVTLDIPQSEKAEILNFFVDNPTISVCSEIIKELDGLQSPILSWFASGDCLDEHADKLFKIMLLLQEEGVIQNGFTRNKNFYQKILSSSKVNTDILRIIFTIESKGKMYEQSCSESYPKWIYGVPNYKTGMVKLYHATLGYSRSYGGCGFNRVVTKNFEGKEIEIATNCWGCFSKKIGCFIEVTK